jgi:hypothetical protein
VLPTGVWSHLAGTYDSTSKTLALYVNGVSEASAITTDDPVQALTGTHPNVSLGNLYQLSQGLMGLLQEARIWNTARSQAQIQASRSTRLTGNESGLVGYWRLGDGSGQNAVADAIGSLKLCPLLHTPEFSRKADRLLVNIIGGTDLTLPKVNELMTAITEQFGRESHVIMGAVIDEQMQNRVEVCVLGTCDMNGRGVMARRPVTAASARTRITAPRSDAMSETPRAMASGTSSGLVHATATAASGEASLEQMVVAGKKIAQDEFGFGELESRGHFEKTDRNLFDGQDLDVPTYLRKGIKITI